uniref:Uncharacterized protein n=1 Tax=Geospiza parvula TaxID=87175 RepID=A0A8C3MNJ7_GEOPR
KNVLDEYFLRKERDLRQVVVLPKAQWERIQGSIGEAPHIDEKKEQEEVDLDSKAAGKEDPRNANLIKEKLQAKKLREEKEEEERKLLDLEEAKFQAAKRKEVIDHAKTYLRYQDDRMRQFHSALLLTKVLNERDAQVEFLKSRLVDSKKKDYEEEQRRFKEYILSEQEKAHQHYMNKQALCKDQLQQGENSRTGIAELGSFRLTQVCCPGMLWKLTFFCRQVQEQRDKIISQLAEQMSEALRKEDGRLARDAARIEAEEEKKRKEKEAKQKAAIESIAEHRATVVRNLALLFLFLHQAEKQARKEQEKQAELDYNAQREAIALYKEQEFQKYAKELIETESKKTHHLYPLLKACENGRGLGHRPGQQKERKLEQLGCAVLVVFCNYV